MNSLAVYDQELAVERAGGSIELATDLFGMLLKELPNYRAALLNALAQEDLTALQRSAHKLHGSATYTGVSALRHAVANLEASLRHKTLADLTNQVDVVLREIDRVLQLAQE